MSTQCPECGTEFIQQIPQRNLVGSLLRRFSIQPFRCQLCRHRFVKLVSGTCHTDELNGTRQYVRFPTRVDATIVGNFPPRQEIITQLSMGGCTLNSVVVPLKLGAFVQMQVRTSDEEPPIRIDTVMIRSVRAQRVGIEFLEFRDEDKERLSQFVKSLWVSRPSVSS